VIDFISPLHDSGLPRGFNDAKTELKSSGEGENEVTCGGGGTALPRRRICASPLKQISEKDYWRGCWKG